MPKNTNKTKRSPEFERSPRVSALSIKHHLMEDIIIDGGLSDGAKMPSVRSIADRYHTNQITVMRAIAELAGEGILATEEKRGVFVRNAGKCRNSVIKNPICAAVLPYADHASGYYFNDVVRVIESAASKAKMRFIVQNLNWASKDISVYLEDFISFYRVSGIIVRVPHGYTDTTLFSRALARGISVVFIDSTLTGVAAPSIVVDNRRGGYLAAEHLLKNGHTRIAFLRDALADSPGRTVIEQDRFDGFRDALAKAGIAFDPAMDILLDTPLARYSGSEIAERIRTKKITAVFAYNDQNAAELITHLSARGIRVPDDVSVIGYDNIAVGGMELTTIDPHKERMGSEAAARMLSVPAGEETITITPDLVVRASTRAVRQ